MPISTDPVRLLYESLPFPSGGTPYLVEHWTELIKVSLRQRSLKLFGSRFLDAGCGTGDNLLRLAELFPELRFEGIDLSEVSVSLAREKAHVRKLLNVSFSWGDLKNLKRNAEYDFVSALGVLHHTPEPRESLANLLGALKPRGVAFVDLYGYYGYLRVGRGQEILNLFCPDFFELDKRLKIMEWLAPEVFNIQVPSDPRDPAYILLADDYVTPYAYSYRIKEAVDLLEEAGLHSPVWLDRPVWNERNLTYRTFRGDIISVAFPDELKQQLESWEEMRQYCCFESVFAPYDYLLMGMK